MSSPIPYSNFMDPYSPSPPHSPNNEAGTAILHIAEAFDGEDSDLNIMHHLNYEDDGLPDGNSILDLTDMSISEEPNRSNTGDASNAVETSNDLNTSNMSQWSIGTFEAQALIEYLESKLR